MSVLKIHLSNFRNIEDKLFEFSQKTTVIVGPNASGKTNILESLFLLSTGKSFRARIEEEMINYDEEVARAKGLFKDGVGKGESTIKLEAVLTRGEIGVGTAKPEKVARKRMLVNGVSKRLIDFAGNFRMVLFGPWDLELVTESPSIRRRFLDTVLSQVDREYRRAALSYEKGLRQRNKLLFRMREEGLPRSQLLFWDRLIIKNGNYISQKREELIGFINNKPSLNEQDFTVEYDKSAISEARLEQYKDEEVAAATTLVGPHRDDFCFKVKNPDNKRARELARYGSRGEQRMGVLWLKLAELAFIKSETGEKPTLLLDDIFSELDPDHRKVVMKASKGQQTIITTANPHFVEKLEKVEKIRLNG
ncbi:DNA replication and repair protein RecF [Patescibacteria group bacterium]|nr:DNA replication and repair protein RecF [Patescibacteria group bacterium]MBU1066829.1 DNA replication and repair protein RecF [Patescibacteria group bacterium]